MRADSPKAAAREVHDLRCGLARHEARSGWNRVPSARHGAGLEVQCEQDDGHLHIRAQLLWNPDEDVDALLAEFYPKFYGPAAEPMQVYWSTIFDAWENTICTEHEFFVAAAIYTPQVMAVLKKKLQEAE